MLSVSKAKHEKGLGSGPFVPYRLVYGRSGCPGRECYDVAASSQQAICHGRLTFSLCDTSVVFVIWRITRGELGEGGARGSTLPYGTKQTHENIELAKLRKRLTTMQIAS